MKALIIAAAIIALATSAGCAFNNLADHPPPSSIAGLRELSLPSLTFTGMERGASGEDGDVVRGKLSVRAYETTADAGGYPAAPAGPVLQEMVAAFHTRGQSTATFPKMTLGLELRSSTAPLASENVDLLGLPRENDYVLHSFYSDKSLMRNLIAYRLAGEIEDWAPRPRLVEVWGSQPDGDLATAYQGIYMLLEKIKVDRSRVDIEPMTPLDDSEPAVTGGYLFRIDWGGDHDWNPGTRTRNLAVFEPGVETATAAQRAWFTAYLEGLESCLRSTPVGNWRTYLDEASFVDFFLLNELFYNVDGYRLSTYMHKDRGGRIEAGPIWDFDLSSGNDGRAIPYNQWELLSQLDPGFVDQYPAFWWCEMLHDAAFRASLRSRWEELRGKSFSDAHIASLIRAAVDEARPGIARNYLRWPALTINDPNWWTPMPIPTSDVPGAPITNAPESYTYEDHLQYFKNWLADRITWLDSDESWKAMDDWAGNSELHLDQGGNL
jgi:hypothetical protein